MIQFVILSNSIIGIFIGILNSALFKKLDKSQFNWSPFKKALRTNKKFRRALVYLFLGSLDILLVLTWNLLIALIIIDIQRGFK